MRVLITGSGGFVGRHLAAYAAAQGADVIGTRRPGISLEGKSVELDLTNVDSLRRAVKEAAPDLIFHLAGESSVAASWLSPERTLETNVLGLQRLLEAVLTEKPSARVLVACSSDQYGPVDEEDLPIDESAPFRPTSPYALSKCAQDLIAYQFHYAHGLHVVRTRNFSQIGPGQDARFAPGRFARETARIEAGLAEPVMKTGNLDAIRDFTDVRDSVRALWLVLDSGRPGEAYNVCSGLGRRVGDIVEHFRLRSRKPFRVETDPALVRPVDVPAAWGDGSKLSRETGWRPEISFERALDDLLEDWRKKVKEGA